MARRQAAHNKRPAQSLPEARQLASLGYLIPSRCSHPDTLPSVTNHSERAHSPSTELINRRSFGARVLRTSTRKPIEQMFSAVERSPPDGSLRLEILTGMAKRILFSTRPNRIDILVPLPYCLRNRWIGLGTNRPNESAQNVPITFLRKSSRTHRLMKHGGFGRAVQRSPSLQVRRRV